MIAKRGKKRKKINIITAVIIFSSVVSITSLAISTYLFIQYKSILNRYSYVVSSLSYFSSEHYNNAPIKQITIPIVAVTTTGKGVVGYMHIKAVPGYGNVYIETNPFSEIDLQYSLYKAVNVAKMVTHKNPRYDFIFSYSIGDVEVIGGESAGAAACIGIIALLENKTLKEGAVITGTIELDGSIGKVGGIFEKARAAYEANFSVFLLPRDQSILIYYEKEEYSKEVFPGYFIQKISYIPKPFDLKEYAEKEWNMKIIEVGNIYEAIEYLLE